MESEIFQRFSKKNEIREYLILSEEKSFRIVNDCPTTYITHYQNLANFKLSPTNKPQLRLNNIKLLIWQRAIYKTVSYNLKQAFIILLIFSISSCKQKEECYPEFKESLTYLKDYIKPDNKERLVIEITRNIEVLESISGIMNQDQGNFIGKMMVRQADIDKWEKWISEKCPKNN